MVVRLDRVDVLGPVRAGEHHSLTFTGLRGNAVRRSNFQKHWAATLAQAGLRGVHFHNLPHTGITLTAHAGATLSRLMTRMGHSSTRAARICLHAAIQRDRVVAETLDAVLVRHASGT